MNGEQCFYVRGETTIVDVARDGTNPPLSWVNGETLDQVRKRYPLAELMPLADACKEIEAAQRARYCGPPVEIDAERFTYLLEVLPPRQWRNLGDVESFYLSERLCGNIVTYAVRRGSRYFELNETAGTPIETLLGKVNEAFPLT